MAFEVLDIPASMQPLIKNLAVGLDEKLIDQLVIKSKQPHILKSTPNDAAKRFTDKKAFYVWYGDNHVIHWLLGEQNDLAGIIWYTDKKYPIDTVPVDENPSETFAIRLYDGYIGHHLSVPFMKYSLRVAASKKKEKGIEQADMWLQTTPDNPAAIASYSKLGYKETYRDPKKVIMTIKANELARIVEESD